MDQYASGLLILSAALFAGCSHTPAEETGGLVPKGPGVITEYVSDNKQKELAGCRREAEIGKRIKKWVCTPPEDDRDRLWVLQRDR